MESTIRVSSTILIPSPLKPHRNHKTTSFSANRTTQFRNRTLCAALSNNGAVPHSSPDPALFRTEQDSFRQRGSLESLFCYDKSIPEEVIEKPMGLAVSEKLIGNKPRCSDCQAKGVILCRTCSGSGLYIDSILESQGIMVKVRCLGCGGSGNIMCSDCGGRGHLWWISEVYFHLSSF